MQDQILVESKTMRQQVIGKCCVLDKVKAMTYLTKDLRATIRQTADYYEVPEKTVETVLRRNKDEFSEDGIQVLKKSEFKALSFLHREGMIELFPGRLNRLILLPKRAILRVGMLLTESVVAKSVRNYLLNLEEISTQGQKDWAFHREVGKLRRRMMTDAIRDYIEETPNKHWQYKHYTDLVYRKAFGKSAKELRLEKCVRDNDQLRDKLAKAELDVLEKAECFVAGLIMAGCDYPDIKARINALALPAAERT